MPRNVCIGEYPTSKARSPTKKNHIKNFLVVVALQKATAMRSDDGRASLWWPHPARWGSDSSRAEKSPIKNMILNVSFAIALLSGLLGYAAADDGTSCFPGIRNGAHVHCNGCPSWPTPIVGMVCWRGLSRGCSRKLCISVWFYVIVLAKVCLRICQMPCSTTRTCTLVCGVRCPPSFAILGALLWRCVNVSQYVPTPPSLESTILFILFFFTFSTTQPVAASEKDRTTNPTTIMVVCLLFVMLMVMLVLSVHIRFVI